MKKLVKREGLKVSSDELLFTVLTHFQPGILPAQKTCQSCPFQLSMQSSFPFSSWIHTFYHSAEWCFYFSPCNDMLSPFKLVLLPSQSDDQLAGSSNPSEISTPHPAAENISPWKPPNCCVEQQALMPQSQFVAKIGELRTRFYMEKSQDSPSRTPPAREGQDPYFANPCFKSSHIFKHQFKYWFALPPNVLPFEFGPKHHCPSVNSPGHHTSNDIL